MASYARSRPALDLPSPGRAAVPFALPCAAALGFDAYPRLWPVAAASAALFAGAGTVRALAARRELQAVRRTADRLILQGRHAGTDALAAWRSDELTELAQRRRLQREVKRTLRAIEPGRLPSASPLQRPAARRSAELLRVLADRLGDGRPVAARGMLLAAGLLRSPASPLYRDGADVLLPRALTRVLGALEP